VKKKVVLPAVLSILLLACIILIGYKIWGDPYSYERKNLANELGVKTSDYPGRSFPINYFTDILKPGMSSKEVHQIMRGYTAVFLCNTKSDFPTEFYFFLSTDENTSDRILVTYDKKGKLSSTMVEDTNSRYLQNFVSDCVTGRLGD
jgi:hypothetical protein